MKCVDDYINKLQINGLSRHEFVLPGGSPPLIVYVVEPSGGSKKNVMMYGHLDKMPWCDGWKYGPTEPVIEGDWMYGRGGADDGYSAFSCMLSVKA